MKNKVTQMAVIADSTGHPWSLSVWDVDAGTKLMSYKGAICTPQTLSLVGGDYLISAVAGKPLLQVWALNSRQQFQIRMVCPGRVTALTVSPDGNYCVAGIEEKLHVWQVSTGNLLTVIGRHYQPITCIRFSGDGAYFVSSSEDCQVLVWSLSSVLSLNAHVMGNSLSSVEPMHAWTDHSLPVRDVCVSGGSSKMARVATCSLDQTCKLYELISGRLVLSVVTDTPLTAVTMDTTEYHAFIGGNNGMIYTVKLYEPPRVIEQHLNSSEEVGNIFAGHSKQVSSLSVSLDGLTLLSGSQDQTCRVWHIPSRQCLKVIPHNGTITNAAFIPSLSKIFALDNVKPSLVMQSFKRHLHGAAGEDDAGSDDVIPLTCKPSAQLPEGFTQSSSVETNELLMKMENCQHWSNGERPDEMDGNPDSRELTMINNQLYRYCVQDLLGKLSQK